MWSSPMLLSASTVFALLGLALVVIAGVSDNWLEYQVDRKNLQNALRRQSDLGTRLKDASVTNPLYFTRTYGKIHICFPEDVPSEIGSFSKFGGACITNPDYFPDAEQRDRYNAVQIQRLWFMRAEVVSYIAGVCIIALCLLCGIVGCYRRSAKMTLATALFLFFAVLFLVVSMALWHYVDYIERRLLEVPPFYRSWEQILRQTTRINFGWSYIVAWVGIGFIFFAAIFLLFSYKAIKDEEEQIYESKHAAYFQQYYDKSLVPVSYGGNPYGYGYYPPPSTYYGHPSYGPSNYYGYLSYGAQ
ncbi:PMP-22/EMP/MP20/Claudin tight junction domain-containing protein [Ditylenchus destructor]|uniref:PMP-22/EMP/MP20/Claudin tight junction domain-containing protein n=1 Tax=Ditylenchus destructor TaxID=166010 RepID=A0AAD4NDX1_9BILA|nr:PMP-22/EMP/MP20/Claudin tight junction domain-containing protein [Ditylenchus destructor]